MASSAQSVLVQDSQTITTLWSVGTELIIFLATITVAVLLKGLSRRSASARLKRVAGPASAESRGVIYANNDCGNEGARKASLTAPTTAGRGQMPKPLAQLVDEIAASISKQQHPMKTLALYAELRGRGGHLRLRDAASCSASTPLNLYNGLLQCAGRAGKPEIMDRLLDDMVLCGIDRPIATYESVMRLLAGRKYHREALSVYDRMVSDGLEPSPVTLSCLVCFAAEADDSDRAIAFFERLVALDKPSVRACMTVLRVHAKRKDWPASIDVLRGMRERGDPVDALVLNIVLATGVAAEETRSATTLLQAESATADVVSHNTVLKGLAQQGETDQALRLLAAMQKRGLVPTMITYNTVMDAAVRGGRASEAWHLLATIKSAGLKPDKFSCSILIRDLQQGGIDRLEKALDLVEGTDLGCATTLLRSLCNSILLAAVRDRAAKGQEPRVACLLLRILVLMKSNQLQPTAAEARMFLSRVSRSGDAELIAEVRLLLQSNGSS